MSAQRKMPENRSELIEECVEMRTKTRLYDAQNSTSIAREIASLLRWHQPFGDMSADELKSEWQCASEALKEIE